MIVIPPIQESILKALGKYKFLTSQQLWKLVGNKSLHVIYNDLKVLKERGFSDYIVYGGVSRSGTMAKLHYLTSKGARVTADIEGVSIDQVKYPKSTNTLVKNDFFHRIFTIDMMIAFDKWIAGTEHEPIFFDVYFDKTGSQRKQEEGALKGKTRVEIGKNNFIDPDGIFLYRTNQKDELRILEVANGLDSKRIMQQIRNVVFASYQGYVSEKYKVLTTPKILIAFEKDSTMQAVISRIRVDNYLDSFENLNDYLFFALQSEAKETWSDGWKDISGGTASIWYSIRSLPRIFLPQQQFGHSGLVQFPA
jgi:hypothetical protein